MDDRHPPAMRVARDRLVAAELEVRNRALEAKLESILRSRSWAMTRPLRSLAEWAMARQADGPWQPAPLPPIESGEVAPSPFYCNASSAVDVPQRWLVDVTDLAIHEFHAGVQRVSRQLLREWLIEPPVGARIEPIRLGAEGRYCHARRFLSTMLGESCDRFGCDAPLVPRSSDRFIGLDLLRDYATEFGKGLQPLSEAGVDISILVHDVLPMSNPEWFPQGVDAAFNHWFDIAAAYADRWLCISRYTREQVAQALVQRGHASPRCGLHVFPLGADLPVWQFNGKAQGQLDAPRFRMLSVGTVEVRKGYNEILVAIEALWREGIDLEWTIVGAPGWSADSLIKRLRTHPESGVRLHWERDASDSTLNKLYEQTDLLVHASFGEGYGLPIVEAAAYGSQLLLRDIPIFHEVAGDDAEYFGAPRYPDLQQALRSIAMSEKKKTSHCTRPSWSDSAHVLAKVLSKSVAAD